MTTPGLRPVLAVLDMSSEEPITRVVPLESPIVRADDHGVMYGDGAFETMHLRGQTVWLLDEHLDRLANSLDRLDIAVPAATALTGLVGEAVRAWLRQNGGGGTAEASVKLICTRGPEYDHIGPTCYAVINPVSQRVQRQRHNGVRVRTFHWGISADVRASTPWLLGGIKCLSYAANQAVRREAERQDADDALLVSSDGVVLEGAASSVVWLMGKQLYTVPAQLGILPGITARYVLTHATELELIASEKRVSPMDLAYTDGVWLCSSVRGIVPITTLDGKPIPISSRTSELRRLAGFP